MLEPLSPTIMNVQQPPNPGQGLCHAAFIIVDIQNDFVSGSLKVGTDSEDIIQPINELRNRIPFGCVVHTQDSHPSDHCSFAENNAGAVAFETRPIPTPDGTGTMMDQIMWPTHCIEGTEGWKFHPKLIVKDTDYIQKKGLRTDVDSYSGFFDNFNNTSTGLEDVLRRRGITDVYVCGLAGDFCAGFTACDASKLGFKTYFVQDLTRVVAKESEADMKVKLKTNNVVVVSANQMENNLCARSTIPTPTITPTPPPTTNPTTSTDANTTTNDHRLSVTQQEIFWDADCSK